MTFNKPPRNTAADNYVINMNMGFRWHFIYIFDLLHGNHQPLIPLRPSFQISKAVKALEVPTHACLHVRLYLNTCSYMLHMTHTHEHMHTQLLESPDVCFHSHNTGPGILTPQERCLSC